MRVRANSMDEITRYEEDLVEHLRRVRICLQIDLDQHDVIENCFKKCNDLVSKIELTSRDLPKEKRNMIRGSLKQRKFQMNSLVKQYCANRNNSQLFHGVNNDTAGEARTVHTTSYEEIKDESSDIEQTEEEAFLNALKLQHKDDQMLNEVIQTVIDTTNIATKTATTLHEQTLQINRINHEIDEFDNEIQRAAKKMKQIAIGVLKQKAIWCLSFLILVCIILIILLETGIVKFDKPLK